MCRTRRTNRCSGRRPPVRFLWPEAEEIRDRLARAEAQLRQIKLLLIGLLALVGVLLIPPLRALLGFTLFLAGVVVAVLLFIAVVVQALDWASNTARRPGGSG